MPQDDYDLNWSNFSDHLREMMHGMMKSNHLTDVTLVCDDKKPLAAHKLVLSACSPVFTRLINYLPQTRAVIYLKGIKHQEMQAVLEFMYLGATKIHQERIKEFLEVAKSLEMKEINKNDTTSGLSKNNDNIPTIDEELIEGIIQNSAANFNLDYLTTENIEPVTSAAKLQNPILESLQFKKIEVTSPKQNENQRILQNHDQLKVKKIEIVSPSQDENVNIFSCNHCKYKTKHNNDLTRHILSKHQGVILSCNLCDYHSKYKGNLTKHYQTDHKGSKIEIHL